MRPFLFLPALLAALPAAAATGPCAALEAAYPDPGRAGLAGANQFRPLPVLSPVRAGTAAPGRVAMSIVDDHVSPAAAGKPGFLWVGNYKVTDLPAFRIGSGPGTSFTVTDPESGAVLPMSDACAASPEWGYAGTQWALVQGDTLDVTLQSWLDYAGQNVIQAPVNGAVPCRSANLHTHGLLVLPYHPARAGAGPYGDYIYDVTAPPGSLRPHDTDSCGTDLGQLENHAHGIAGDPLHYVDAIPGHPGINSLKSGEHPSGLFWYHPHPHGYAKPELNGATTGAITVGALTDYACPAGMGSPGHCMLQNTNVRTMVLKETQLQPYGLGAEWQLVLASESNFCSTNGGIRHGECQGSDAGHVGGKWVFTINGVQFPTIHPGPGRTEVWRLVNTSANFTYALSLDGTGRQQGTQAPFQVLARDGVSVFQSANHPRLQTQVLMMPASRIEIAIPPPAGGGLYIFHNQTLGTGGGNSGNVWPSMDLAQVAWRTDTASAAPAPGGFTVSAVEPPAPSPPPNTIGLPARCRFAAGDTRVIYFVHRFAPQRDSFLPPKEIFGLLASVRHADGTLDFFNADGGATLHAAHDVWLWGTGPGADADFPAFGHNPYGTVCTVKGNVEPWELQNWTGEDHNFHPHQSRFTWNPTGAFAYPKFEKLDPPSLTFGDYLVRAYVDPAHPVYADTQPVPRGQSFCAENPNLPGCQPQRPNDDGQCTGEPDAVRCANPGKTSVIMDFTRAEQVGTFVYHCHILEHEDGGMMAQLTVLCPSGDASCAAQQIAQAPICRAKP